MVDVCILSVPRCTFCRPRSSFFWCKWLESSSKNFAAQIITDCLVLSKALSSYHGLILMPHRTYTSHSECSQVADSAFLSCQCLRTGALPIPTLFVWNTNHMGPSKWIDPTLNHGFYVAFRDLIIKYTEKVGWNLGKWHFQWDFFFSAGDWDASTLTLRLPGIHAARSGVRDPKLLTLGDALMEEDLLRPQVHNIYIYIYIQ